MKKRIVITGMGAVTPVGIGTDHFWQGLLSGKCGIDEITRIDVSDLPVKTAGEVKGFRPRSYLPVRLATDLDTFMQFAYVAAEEAIRESGMETASPRVGIVMGTALAGLTLIGKSQEEQTASGKSVGPRFISMIMGNIAAAHLAISYKMQGPSMTVSTACSSGGDAITLAYTLLVAGAADAMVVMAGESTISPLFIQSLSKAGALSKSGNSRPFDKNRDGFVIGEGGGALILETEEHALKRGATIKAELLGCANNTDAYHPVSPEPNGNGAAGCMRQALEVAGIEPRAIDYVNAHGTATIKGDYAETLALKTVFGDYAVPVSSTKGATGHMMGAGGITEVIACIKSIETGIIAPNINYSEKDEGCDLNLIVNEPANIKVDVAMSNALGFGGQNSSIIVGRYSK